VLPHRGGGAEKYIDMLERLPGYTHERFYLSADRMPGTAIRSIPRRGPRLLGRARAADLIHCHGDSASVIALPLMWTRPAVMTTHGLHMLRRAQGLGGLAIRAGMVTVGRSCRTLICTSPSECDELAQILRPTDRPKLRVIDNGVDPPRPISTEARTALRDSLKADSSTVLGLFVGELEPRKGPLTAARAAVEARRRGAPFVLALAGDGSQAPALRALAGEGVLALGHRSDVELLMSAADVFVQPSEREGASYALLEAMGHGLAVVASNGAGNPEAVGDTGLLVELGDSEALTDALLRLSSEPELRASLGGQAAARAAEMFTAARFLEETEAIYRAALAGVREPARASGGARA
jgi:glycosyltransferase involved in cell wall biosynthesis